MFHETPPSAPFQTPMSAPQGINGGAQAPTPIGDASQPAKSVQDIHTMPGKFLSSPSRGGKKKSPILLIVVIILAAVLCSGGVLLFFRLREPAANTNSVTNTPVNNRNLNSGTNGNVNANTNAATNGNANTNANTNAAANANTTALPLIAKGSLSDPETNEKISTLTLTVPAGALPTTVTTVNITALSAQLGAYAASEKYQAVGAVFVITPSQTKLSKDATVEIAYTDSELLKLGYSVKESDLLVASWSQTEWVPLNSLVDTKNNLVSTKIDQFYADGIAVVVQKPVATNTNTTSNTNTGTGTVVPSIDSDADGLTNQEEILYGTNAGSADTDLDGYKDGQEVLGLYNPNGTGRLVTSSLVKTHENSSYRYSLLYPPTWTVGTLNADKLATFTSITGEFVQVSVQENTGKLSAREWYLSLNPSVAQTQIRDIAVGSLTGILGPDKLNVFFADSAYIYQVTYNIGIKTEANYLTTFTMMYSSFQAGIAPAGTNTNAATNTNTTTNVNTNSNTNTAANTNGG